jgi:hypothetical protein
MNVQCACGAVELRLDGAPLAQFYCHCDDCQRVHGGAYAPEAIYPASAVSVLRGATRSWALKTTPRVSCAKCGTRLYADVVDQGLRGVSGYLLPEGAFEPAFHMHCRFALLPVRDPLPHYRGLPSAFGGSDEVVAW